MERASPGGLKRFLALCTVDFSARTSYNMARTPVLPLFAAALGAEPALVGLIVAASTITGIFLKAPAGAISDQIGRKRTLLFGAAVFGITPFFYLLVRQAWQLLPIRFFHGLATAVYGPVVMAAVAAIAKRESLGAAMGTFGTVADTGQALGPIVVGALLAWVGYLPAFSLLSGFLLLWTGMFLRLRLGTVPTVN